MFEGLVEVDCMLDEEGLVVEVIPEVEGLDVVQVILELEELTGVEGALFEVLQGVVFVLGFKVVEEPFPALIIAFLLRRY